MDDGRAEHVEVDDAEGVVSGGRVRGVPRQVAGVVLGRDVVLDAGDGDRRCRDLSAPGRAALVGERLEGELVVAGDAVGHVGRGHEPTAVDDVGYHGHRAPGGLAIGQRGVGDQRGDLVTGGHPEGVQLGRGAGGRAGRVGQR